MIRFDSLFIWFSLLHWFPHFELQNSGVTANCSGQLLYRSVVGYLGTIEMPEDSSSPSSASSGIGGGASASAGSNSSAAARLAAIR